MKKKTILLTLLVAVAALALSGCQASPSLPEANDLPFIVSGGPRTPTNYSSLERFLADMAMIKFDEANEVERADGHIPFRELYMPREVPEGFSLSRMWFFSLYDDLPIVFEYINTDYNTARFTWHRNRRTDEIWVRPNFEGDSIFRAQHGYEFQFDFPVNLFAEQEVYDFSYAQPLIA